MSDHQLTVDDFIWERYHRSPTRMRAALYRALIYELERSAPSGPIEFGPLFQAGRSTHCPACGKRVRPGDQARMGGPFGGEGRAYHADCAARLDAEPEPEAEDSAECTVSGNRIAPDAAVWVG